MSFEKEMKQYDEQWETDQATTPGMLPDGEYKGNNAAQITESVISERDGAYSWSLKFTAEYDVQTDSGASRARGSVRKWYNFDHEVSRSIAAQDAKRLGYFGPLSGLEKACMDGQFDDLVCEIKVETKPGTDRDFTNVYINKVLGKSEAVAAAASPTDDDIPF